MTRVKRNEKEILKNVENDEILKLKKLTASPEVTLIIFTHLFTSHFVVLVQSYW